MVHGRDERYDRINRIRRAGQQGQGGGGDDDRIRPIVESPKATKRDKKSSVVVPIQKQENDEGCQSDVGRWAMGGGRQYIDFPSE